MQNSLNSAVLSKAIEKGIGRAIKGDEGVGLRIRYVGSPEAGPGNGDAVVVAATSLTLSANGSADSTVGATGVLAFATYTTLGTLVDAINKSANWEAVIVAGLRSDAVDGSELLARSTSPFRPFKSLDLFWDSSTHLSLDFLLEPTEAFEALRSPDRVKTHRVGFVRTKVRDNNSGDALTLNVYELLPDKAAVHKTLGSWAVTDDTELDTGEDAAVMHADYGNSILVRFAGATTLAGAAASYNRVQGVRQ